MNSERASPIDHSLGITYEERVFRAEESVRELRDAAKDALSGWRYIRETHGDLYGVAWDRVENKLRIALGEGKS